MQHLEFGPTAHLTSKGLLVVMYKRKMAGNKLAVTFMYQSDFDSSSSFAAHLEKIAKETLDEVVIAYPPLNSHLVNLIFVRIVDDPITEVAVFALHRDITLQLESVVSRARHSSRQRLSL